MVLYGFYFILTVHGHQFPKYHEMTADYGGYTVCFLCSGDQLFLFVRSFIKCIRKIKKKGLLTSLSLSVHME